MGRKHRPSVSMHQSTFDRITAFAEMAGPDWSRSRIVETAINAYLDERGVPYQQEPAPIRADDLSESDARLLRVLEHWREQTAASHGMPATWVLCDQALIEIAKVRPKNRRELAKITGVGAVRLSMHAAAILNLLRGYRDEAPSEDPAEFFSGVSML